MRRVQDLISRIGWGPCSYREEALGVLLLERDADFPGNRRALYVCPECGDLACGAVTAVVERLDDRVVWRDFNYKTEIDPPIDLEALRGFGHSPSSGSNTTRSCLCTTHRCLRNMAPDWTAKSLALHTQAVIQGAFILAKATGGAEIAADSIDHLRRYIEMLFGVATEQAKDLTDGDSK